MLEVIDPASQPKDRVLFGARVSVLDESGKRRIYRIVGIDEADPARGEISWISPLAKALLNRKVGDVAVFQSPKGSEDLEIVSIE